MSRNINLLLFLLSSYGGCVSGSSKGVFFSFEELIRRKIAGRFSAAILRGSSGIGERCCRHNGLRRPPLVVLQVNDQQSIHEAAVEFIHQSCFSGFRDQLPSSVLSR